MSIIVPFGIIALSGAFGGILNAITTDNGFILPREETTNNSSIILPGAIANILIGAATGFIYWGLTEANSASIIYGGATPGEDTVKITVYGVAMSLLAGAAGAKYLTNEIDKRLLKAAAIAAAVSRPSLEDAERIARATPLQAFKIAKKMLPQRTYGPDTV
jgi:hypothetical protein